VNRLENSRGPGGGRNDLTLVAYATKENEDRNAFELIELIETGRKDRRNGGERLISFQIVERLEIAKKRTHFNSH